MCFFDDRGDDPSRGICEAHSWFEDDTIVIDFHPEATSEKQAVAHVLDGRVSLVVETYAHVPTADKNGLATAIFPVRIGGRLRPVMPDFRGG